MASVEEARAGRERKLDELRGICKVEAESVALVVGAAHGMDTTGYTIPYVSTWASRVAGKEPVDVVKVAGERVRKTTLTILDQLNMLHLSNGVPPGLDREAPERKSPSSATVAPAGMSHADLETVEHLAAERRGL